MRRAAIPSLLVLALAGRAHAQSKAEAEALFREGRLLFEKGRVEEACAAFAASQKADPDISTLTNLANCREKNGQLASAWGLFLEVARDARTEGRTTLRETALARVAALEPRLSHLVINVPDDSRVDGLVVTRNDVAVDPGAWNRSLPVDGGIYVVKARVPGRPWWSTRIQIRAERDNQSADIPRFAELPLAAHPAAPSPDTAVASPGDEPDGEPVDSPSSPWWQRLGTERIAALGLWGGAAVALGGSLALDLSARDTYDQSKREPDDGRQSDLYDRAVNRRRTAQVVAGLGIAGAIAGAALWWLGAPEPLVIDAGIDDEGDAHLAIGARF